MAKSHFAIERPRKISISIEGYNAEAQTKTQKRKLQERSQRLKRKAEAAQKRQREEPPPKSVTPPKILSEPTLRVDDTEEIEALNRAAAAELVDSEIEQDLMAALAVEKHSHEDE